MPGRESEQLKQFIQIFLCHDFCYVDLSGFVYRVNLTIFLTKKHVNWSHFLQLSSRVLASQRNAELRLVVVARVRVSTSYSRFARPSVSFLNSSIEFQSWIELEIEFPKNFKFVVFGSSTSYSVLTAGSIVRVSVYEFSMELSV